MTEQNEREGIKSRLQHWMWDYHPIMADLMGILQPGMPTKVGDPPYPPDEENSTSNGQELEETDDMENIPPRYQLIDITRSAVRETVDRFRGGAQKPAQEESEPHTPAYTLTELPVSQPMFGNQPEVLTGIEFQQEMVTVPETLLAEDAVVANGDAGVDTQDPQQVSEYLYSIADKRQTARANLIVTYQQAIHGDPSRDGNVLGITLTIGRGRQAREEYYDLLDISSPSRRTLEHALIYFTQIGITNSRELESILRNHGSAERERTNALAIVKNFNEVQRERLFPWTRGLSDDEIVRSLWVILDYKRRNPEGYLIYPAHENPQRKQELETVFSTTKPVTGEGDILSRVIPLLNQVTPNGLPVSAGDQEKALKFYRSIGLLNDENSREIMKIYYDTRRFKVFDEETLGKQLRKKIKRVLGQGYLCDTVTNMQELKQKDGAPFDVVPQMERIKESNQRGERTYLYGVRVPGSAVMRGSEKLAFQRAFDQYLIEHWEHEVMPIYFRRMVQNPPNQDLGLESYSPGKGNERPVLVLVEPTEELMIGIEYGQGHANLLPQDGLLFCVREILGKTLAGAYKIRKTYEAAV